MPSFNVILDFISPLKKINNVLIEDSIFIFNSTFFIFLILDISLYLKPSFVIFIKKSFGFIYSKKSSFIKLIFILIQNLSGTLFKSKISNPVPRKQKLEIELIVFVLS